MYVESTGVLVRCVVTFCLVKMDVSNILSLHTHVQYGLIAFGIAHLAYSIILVVGYFGYFLLQPKGSAVSFVPTYLGAKYVDNTRVTLTHRVAQLTQRHWCLL